MNIQVYKGLSAANSNLEQLAETATDMLRTAIATLVVENADEARDDCQMDDRADECEALVKSATLG